jgi:Mg-chelatase subunit ChlI
MEIIEVLRRILKGEALERVEIDLNKDAYSRNEDVSEFSIDALLCLTIPFIQGAVSGSLTFYEEYCSECEFFKLVPEKFIAVRKRQEMGTRGFEREDKISILKIKQRFLNSPWIWDNREWIIELLLYLYLLSVENVFYRRYEDELKAFRGQNEVEKEVKREIQFFTIDEKRERRELLVSRNNPTMSLEEFAEKETQNMEKREEASETEEDESADEESLETLRRKDEFRDSGMKGSGNTRGWG